MADEGTELHRATTARERRAERNALVAGLSIAAVAIGVILVALVTVPPAGQRLVAQALAQTILGRETGLPTGLALGSPPLIVATLGAAQDTTVLLVGYGLVMLAARGTLRVKWLQKLADRPHEKRDAFGARTESVGIALLALGLWIPFLPGGALVAALLARVAGYRAHIFLPTLAVSAILADYAYVLALDQLGRLIPRWALPLLALAVVAIVGGGIWLSRRVAKKA